MNNISDGDSPQKRRTGARWLEELLNTGGTPIVMTARREFRTVLLENPFLQRRLTTMPELRGFRWTDGAELKDFRKGLAYMEDAYGMAERVASKDLRISTRLCIATHGLFGTLDIVIRDAAARTRGKSMLSLSRDLLSEVISDRLAMSARPMRNPFEVPEEDLQREFASSWSGGKGEA